MGRSRSEFQRDRPTEPNCAFEAKACPWAATVLSAIFMPGSSSRFPSLFPTPRGSIGNSFGVLRYQVIVDLRSAGKLSGMHPDMVLEFARAELIAVAEEDRAGNPYFAEMRDVSLSLGFLPGMHPGVAVRPCEECVCFLVSDDFACVVVPLQGASAELSGEVCQDTGSG